LIGSPRCDFIFIRKVALPARTRCVSRHTISCRMSVSGDVANVAFPPCPTHFLITHKSASLSHNRRVSSLSTVDCNTSTIPPNSGLFELVSSSSLPTRTHLPAPSSLKAGAGKCRGRPPVHACHRLCADFRQCGSFVEVCVVDCVLSLGGQ
jgi:hypothetical protein